MVLSRGAEKFAPDLEFYPGAQSRLSPQIFRGDRPSLGKRVFRCSEAPTALVEASAIPLIKLFESSVGRLFVDARPSVSS
jgi:hypothetical protein